MTSLTLGTIAFTEWELPETIPFGGKQAYTIHRMSGGARIIDALGPDDTNIGWSGRFFGTTAELRARRVDLLRRSGKAVLLSWSSFVYEVVVTAFRGDFTQSFNIPYQIEVAVVRDVVSDVLGPLVQQGEDMIRDGLSDALGATAGDTVLTPIVTGLQTTFTDVLTSGTRPTLASISTSAMAGLQAGSAQAFASSTAVAETADATLSGTDAIRAGGEPQAMAQQFETQTGAAQQAARGRAVSSRLGRTNAVLRASRGAVALPLPPPASPAIPAAPAVALPPATVPVN
jgi:hypothetical protein